MKTQLEFALEYGKRGISVFPIYEIAEDGQCSCGKTDCGSPGKHPRTPHGLNDATTDEAIIRQLWQQYPKANIGLRTGATSGFVAVDIDPRHDGYASLGAMQERFGPIPETVRVRTGSGGHHSYFKYPGSKIGNRKDFYGPGLDFRGDGGYVVAAGSNHISGGTYEWEVSFDDAPLAEIPAWLLDILLNKKHQEKKRRDGSIPNGSRNDTLFRRACGLRARGLEKSEIFEKVQQYNLHDCTTPLSESETRKIAESAAKYERGHSKTGANKSGEVWEPRKPLPPKEPGVPALTEDMIPESFRDWVNDATDRMQNAPEMMAVAVVVALSGLVGRRCAILPKQLDDWKVVPNLWGGLIAPPSWLKTPSLIEALRGIYILEKELRATFMANKIAYEVEKAEHDAAIEEVKGRIKEDRKSTKGKNLKALKSELEKLIKEKPQEPIVERLLTNDATTQKLGELLNENPRGLIVFRDELYGFLMSLEKEGHEQDRAFYLEAWNGNGKYTYDRIGRGTIHIDALCLSILGGIQPDRLSSYFSSVLKSEGGDDGFLSRFQIMVYPNQPKIWKLVDRKPNQQARDKASEIFRKIYHTNYFYSGFDEGGEEVPATRFDDGAQEAFNRWITDLELKLRSGTIESPAFEAYLGKYRSLMPSLALLFHLVDFVDEKTSSPKVSRAATELAIKWCAFLEGHAKRIYAGLIRPDIHAAHLLAKKIEQGKVLDGMTVREVYRKGWSQLTEQKIVLAGLEALAELNWLRLSEVSPTGQGAPSEIIRLHPNLVSGGANV